MKLIKLEINNFRQFYGKQTIDFSIDPDRGVTLIHGENNGGKTALLNALRWCLYEETTENLQDSKNLINKHAVNQRTNIFSVNLQLEHNNRLLEVRRSQSRVNPTSKVQVFEIIDGCYSERSEDNPNTLINTFLPKEMSQYFFYQGEGTGTLSSQNDFSHIKDAIDKVLGLTVAKTTIKHLGVIKTGYQKELRQYDTDNEIDKLISDKEHIESLLEKDIVTLDDSEKRLEFAEKEYEYQISQLARFDKTVIEDKIRLRDQKERLLSDLERQHKQLLDSKLKLSESWALQAFSTKLSNVELASINTEELNKSLRYSVDKQLLNEIIHNQECICGSEVNLDSAAANLLKELGKHAVDPELKMRWALSLQLKDRLLNNSSPKKTMQDLLIKIDDYEGNIDEVQRDINELSHQIIDSDIDDIKVIEKNKKDIKLQCDQLHSQIPQLKQTIKKRQLDIKGIDDRISMLSSTQPKASKIRKFIQAIDKIIALYNEEIESSKSGVDLLLLQKMRDFFGKVAFNGYTVKKSSSNANDSFTWVIVDNVGNKVAAGNGYQAMLAISFVVALIDFSKGRANSKKHLLTPGTTAPFIADSILAFIGPDNGRELIRYIADSVEQSIFMFSQAQWTESHTDVGIRDKIGKEYNLVQHTILTEEEFKGQYPTHLAVQGIQYDVVRFGSEFDKVTIEEINSNV
jgi:DNA sulfur modification protein DndD